MPVRLVLKTNFEALLKATHGLKSVGAVIEAGGGTNGTLGRIRTMKISTSIDQVEQLAQVYGLKAWQLLHPHLLDDEGKLTNLVPWPLQKVSQNDFEALSYSEKLLVEGVVVALLLQLKQKPDNLKPTLEIQSLGHIPAGIKPWPKPRKVGEYGEITAIADQDKNQRHRK